MNTHIMERSNNPFDLLFRNLFDTGATFEPAGEAKQQYPINIFESNQQSSPFRLDYLIKFRILR